MLLPREPSGVRAGSTGSLDGGGEVGRGTAWKEPRSLKEEDRTAEGQGW